MPQEKSSIIATNEESIISIIKKVIAQDIILNSERWDKVKVKMQKIQNKKNQNKKHLRNMAIKSGIQFIDGSKVIDSNNLHDYMPKGGHLSDFGNKKIGDLISEEIAN